MGNKHRLALILCLLLPAAFLLPLAPAFSLESEPSPEPIITPPVAAPPPDLSPDQEEKIEHSCETKDLEFVDEADACTHGGDPPPAGKNIYVDVKPIVAASPPHAEGGAATTAAAGSFTCDGDGVSGPRTQVVYVRGVGSPDRFETYKASIQAWAGQADQIYKSSAAETGGTRRIRFVHDAGCTPVVLNLVIPQADVQDFGDSIDAMVGQGYNRTDRVYLMFVDANYLCGVSTLMVDDRPGQDNANNVGPNYSRVDAGCWSGDVAAHEHMHSMGGVQNSAPHGSGGAHCTDEYDIMCYSDAPDYPAMIIRCSDSSRDTTRFDCNHDDYFNTSPSAGSYLATKWNAANNRFLVGGGGVVSCADSATEPNDTAGTARSIPIGGSQTYAFCASGDSDWVKFDGAAGKTYRVTVNSPAQGAEPALQIYGNSGKILLRSDDPAGATIPKIDFTVRTSGTYYVRAIDNPSGVPAGNRTYNLTVNNGSDANHVGGWGYNGLGALGVNPNIVSFLTEPLLAAPDLTSGQLSAGVMHSLALGTDGVAWAYGWNSNGQLGDGTLVDRPAPTRVSGLNNVVSLSAGGLHSVAALSDGSVWAWGFNGFGQLGDGTTDTRTTPVRVQGLTDVVEVAAGTWHSLALKRDGTVWAWGWNVYGGLGDGSGATRLTPVKVPIDGVMSISGGGFHTLAAKSDGTVWSWGYNANGQLGDGTHNNRLTPGQVTGLSNVYQVAAGLQHSIVLRNDGAVLGWGWNAYQQAGSTTIGDQMSPTPVLCSADSACPRGAGIQLGKIVRVSAGGFHSTALSMDGRAWSWGLNNIGQLGDGGAVDSARAVGTRNPLTLSDLSAGFVHTIGG